VRPSTIVDDITRDEEQTIEVEVLHASLRVESSGQGKHASPDLGFFERGET